MVTVQRGQDHEYSSCKNRAKRVQDEPLQNIPWIKTAAGRAGSPMVSNLMCSILSAGDLRGALRAVFLPDAGQ